MSCVSFDSIFDKDLLLNEPWNVSSNESRSIPNEIVSLNEIQPGCGYALSHLPVGEHWATNSDSGCSMDHDTQELPEIEEFFTDSLPSATLASINAPVSDEITYTDLTTQSSIAVTASNWSVQQNWSSGNQYAGQVSSDSEDSVLGSIDDLEVSDVEFDIAEIEYSQNPNRDFQIFAQNCSESTQLPDIYTVLPQQQQQHEAEQDTQKYRKRGSMKPKLSLFILYALENPSLYQSMIRWIDRSNGVFEFSSQNKEKLARAWGLVKRNRKQMTYQKMSRALRIYIKKEKVMKKMKRKLQYVFRQEFQEGAIVLMNESSAMEMKDIFRQALNRTR